MVATEDGPVLSSANVCSNVMNGAACTKGRRVVGTILRIAVMVNANTVGDISSDISRSRRNGQNAQKRNQHKHQRKRSLQVGEAPTTGHVKMFVVTHVDENTSFSGRSCF